MKLLRTIPLLVVVGCANEPIYIDSSPTMQIEVGGDLEPTATATQNLPWRNFADGSEWSMEYEVEREARLQAINGSFDPDLTIDQLPYVRLDQVDVSIEWSIRNLDAEPGQAFIDVNGANQYFAYVPASFVVAGDDDEPLPPPLAGHVPIDVGASATISGVFREDTLRESALDLELITRGALNPFYAIINNNEDIQATTDVEYVPYPPPEPGDPPPPTPVPLPVSAFGHFVRFDVTFSADRHMVLEYAVRVRDPDHLLHDELLGADAAELMTFMPADYVPPTAPP